MFPSTAMVTTSAPDGPWDFHFESDAGIQDGRDLVVTEVGRALIGAQTVHHGHTAHALTA